MKANTKLSSIDIGSIRKAVDELKNQIREAVGKKEPKFRVLS
jgi:hypothetical protein